jgi:membrane-associated phospholipid phosphatase
VTGNRRVWFWLVACAIVVLALTASFWLDSAVRSWMLEHPNRQLRNLMAAISRYGNWPQHVALGIVLLLLAWWRGSKRWTRVFFAMLLACALAGATGRVIKIASGRARPSVKSELAWNGPRLSEKFHAFPSGHTASSTAFFAVLLFVRWRIGVTCLLIPMLIAFSRMYVAAHYFSDVVFAAVLGLVCASLAARWLKISGAGDSCN